MALLGLLTLTVAAAGKDKEVPSAASAAALAQQLAAQAKQIKALERQVSRLSGGGSCAADAEDPEPELQAFRAAERQKRAMKRQDELVTLFTATVRAKKDGAVETRMCSPALRPRPIAQVGEPLTAVGISSGLLDKSVPKLIVCAGASGTKNCSEPVARPAA